MEAYPGIGETELFAALRRCMEDRLAIRMQNKFSFPDGETGWFELSIQAVPEGIFILSQDITERRRLQEQLVDADKLASVGQLAAGVAHEINNPLTAILSFSEFLLSQDLDEFSKNDLSTIREEAQRATKVVQDLFSFGKRQKPSKELVIVSQIIQSAVSLKTYDFRANNIEVHLDIQDESLQAMANGNQLTQVFVNILTNAQHAMADSHGRGTLTITLCRVGVNVRVSFADDGPGIPEDQLPKVFDPFFSTKRAGEGTGLSVSYGIIRDHDGRIWAESEPGIGAILHVEFPGWTHPSLGQA